MKYSISASLVLAPLAFAAVHQVQVGPGLSYSPEELTAESGDVVEFVFGSGHDVVSGSFDNPCQPSGNVNSGEPNDGEIFSVTLNDTNPLWIYCSVPRHCQSGMAMVINPASGGDTLSSYKSAARSVGSSSSPDEVSGGVYGAASDNSASSSSESSAFTSTEFSSSGGAAATTTPPRGDQSAYATGASVTSAGQSSTATSSGFAAPTLVSDLSLIAGAVVGGLALML